MTAAAAATEARSRPTSEPAPLPHVLQPVPPFPEQLLPTAFRDWTIDVADRSHCPPEYVAVGLMVGFSALVGRSRRIMPKARDTDWSCVPNLWGLAVGPPGVMKTPALTEALKPIRPLEAEAQRLFDEALREHHAVAQIADAKREALRARMKALAVKGGPIDEFAKELAALEPKAPAERRYIVNDTTVEKLGVILNENPRGVLLFRDEMLGFLRTFDRQGHEGDRAFYLEAWSGDRGFTYDRIGRGTLRIEAACVSILGCIQPDPLGEYLRDSLSGNSGNDGLVQRFQLAVYPDFTRAWENIDRPPNETARRAVTQAFQHADDLWNGGSTPRALHFDAAAQALFDSWRTDLETVVLSGREHPALTAHLTKYRSLMPSLALLLELSGAPDASAVGFEATAQAAAWCDFLEAHARRIYAGAESQAEVVAATAILEKLRAGDLRTPFTARDVYHPRWKGLDRERTQKGLATLVEYGWLSAENAPTGGRPSERFHAHPLALRTAEVTE